MSTFSIPRNIDTLTIDLSEHDREIRNKAIDEFLEAIDRADREEPLILYMYKIGKIAEQLKAGG